MRHGYTCRVLKSERTTYQMCSYAASVRKYLKSPENQPGPVLKTKSLQRTRSPGLLSLPALHLSLVVLLDYFICAEILTELQSEALQ